MIAQIKIKQLIKAGEDFGLQFNLPPFDGDINEGFYDVDSFKKTKKFNEFIGIIDKIGVKYEYSYKKNCNKKIFMVIKMKE